MTSLTYNSAIDDMAHNNINFDANTLKAIPVTKNSEYDRAMQQLFTAKWNIPQAAASLGMCASQKDWEDMKMQFSDYCKLNPATYAPAGN